MRSKRLFLLAILTAACSWADILTFTHTGTGSGQIGTTSFTNAPFTITEVANTANRTGFSGGFSIDDTSATITIDALGTFKFTTPTRTFVNNDNKVIGFSRGGVFGADLFDGPGDPAFATYELLGSVGPISGTGTLMQWNLTAVRTDGGVLVFNDGSSDARFGAAAAVPEPGSMLLLGTMLIGIGAFVRRRCQR